MSKLLQIKKEREVQRELQKLEQQDIMVHVTGEPIPWLITLEAVNKDDNNV